MNAVRFFLICVGALIIFSRCGLGFLLHYAACASILHWDGTNSRDGADIVMMNRASELGFVMTLMLAFGFASTAD